MPNSPLLQIPQVAPNQSSKETTINDGFSILERSLNDVRGINLATADVELNMEDYTRAFLFELTGHTVARVLTLPASKRLFSVFNKGSQYVDVKVKAAAGGSLVARVPSGSYCVLFNNGADVRMISDSAASGQVSAFLSLPDTPNSFAGQKGRAMIVNVAENALTFGTITVKFADLTDTPSTLTPGKVPRVNTAGDAIVFADYVDKFLTLTDTPGSFAMQAGKMVIVNSLENALVFEDIPEAVIQATRQFTLPNNGFESNNLTHWTQQTTDETIWKVGAGYGLIGPYEGLRLAYYETGQGADPASIGYAIDLTSQAYPEELDDGCNIVIDVAMGSNDSHLGYIEAVFFDDADVEIGTAQSPTYAAGTSMTMRRLKAPVPEGARKVIAYIRAEVNPEAGDPTNLDFTVDFLQVQLKLTVDQIVNFTQLFDAPHGYAGFASKVVAVKADESGLEFVERPVSVSAFTELTDSPSDYTGASLKFVRVKNDLSGLEFVKPTFLQLGDTPTDFTGKSGNVARVNSAENALVFSEFKVAALEDVDWTTPTQGQTLSYDTTKGKFVLATGGGGAVKFAELTDVDVTTAPTEGQVPKWDDTAKKWKPGTASGGIADAPTDGKTYARKNAAWAEVSATVNLTITSKTDNYILALADAGTYIRMTKSTGLTLTVPADATVNFPVGTQVLVRQSGAGQVTVVAASGAFVNSPETLKLRKNGSTATLIKVAANTWDVIGDLELS